MQIFLKNMAEWKILHYKIKMIIINIFKRLFIIKSVFLD